MRKIYGFMGLLLALSIGGYLLPEKTEALPDRILMPNTGGRVVFDHAKHTEGYGVTCVECHHDIYKPRDDKSCLTCHNKNMDLAKVPCKTCHGVDFGGDFKSSHASMSEDKQVCVTCHHTMFRTKEPGQTDGSCWKALEETEHQDWSSRKEAGHARYAESHADMLTGDLKDCAMCHRSMDAEKMLRRGKDIDAALISCSACHEQEPKKLIPGSMAAYHGLCIGCHSQKGGPTDECAQCHRK